MKRFLTTTAALLALASSAFAQDPVQNATAKATAAFLEASEKAEAAVKKPSYWTESAAFDLGFTQTGLWSWAAGGYNTLTLNMGIDANANYEKGLMGWKNRLQLNYGFLWSADKKNLLQKSNDRIRLESSFAYRTSENSKWNYTASYDFRSQFSNSYDKYVQDPETEKWSGTLKSGFLSPAYTNIAFGMAWKPCGWFDVNIAPLTGGFTIVTTEDLRKGYGMKLRPDAPEEPLGADYYSALFQFGAQVKMNLRASINDVFKYDTQLVLFTDYLDAPFRHTRVNWDNNFSWLVSKHFKLAFNTWLIYDPLVVIDGRERIQFKEFFSFNFTYSIASKKK